MKKLAAIFCTFLMLCTSVNAEIYTYDETEPITKGVTLRHIQRFYGDKWLNINCVAADLTDEHVKLELLKNENMDKLNTIDNFTKTQENVLAAANGDFFDNTFPKTSQGFSLGIEIKDKELLQSHINENMAAGFYDGESLIFDYMKMNITVTAPNGEATSVKHINKHTSYYGDVLMYTSKWNGGNSPGVGREVVEVVVENDVITQIRHGEPSVKIPENGYVLAVSEGVNMFFSNNTKVGDTLKLDISVTPSIENVQTAFGGGTLLLKNGEIQPFTHSAPGYNPRTCIGTNGDGTMVYIITVDGRQHDSKGVTLTELAELALELGCTEALNLDGGGSTRMNAKTFWNSELHTVNIPTENRRVINAVAITSDAVTGSAVGVKMKPSRKTVLAGDEITLESRFYDENENVVWISDSEPVFTLNEAVVEKTFYPSQSGILSAVYGGEVTDTAQITVIDTVSGISLPQSLSIGVGESVMVQSEVYDNGGRYAFVQNVDLLSPTAEGSISYTGGTVTGIEEGWGILTLNRDNASAKMLVKVGNPEEEMPKVEENINFDPLLGTTEAKNTFSIFAYDEKPHTFFDNFHYIEGLKKISSSDSYGFLGEYDSTRLPQGMRTPILANSFSAIDKGFALIASLPQSGELSGAAWVGMANAIEKTSAKNIIFMTKTAVTGEEIDVKVFYDYIEKLSESKNVFLVQSGERNDVHIRKNVHFITLADSGKCKGIKDSIANSKYLKFFINDGDCRFDFVNLF